MKFLVTNNLSIVGKKDKKNFIPYIKNSCFDPSLRNVNKNGKDIMTIFSCASLLYLEEVLAKKELHFRYPLNYDSETDISLCYEISTDPREISHVDTKVKGKTDFEGTSEEARSDELHQQDVQQLRELSRKIDEMAWANAQEMFNESVIGGGSHER